MFVVDANNWQGSWDAGPDTDCRSVLHDAVAHPDLQSLPLLVFTNKQDLPGAITVSECIANLDLPSLSCDWHVQCCCALTGDGLFEGLEWLHERLLDGPIRKS